MGAAIPFSVREVKSQRESEETGKGLSAKGELVVEVKRCCINILFHGMCRFLILDWTE